MTRSFSPTDTADLVVIAVKQATTAPAASSTSVYRARVDESGNSYTFSGNSWTVYDKKGTRYLFGSDDTGRQYDTAAATSSKTPPSPASATMTA